uniref:Uncharacterized protein n=1 Tax=Ananas comosus var. bracteatus TaxID=296719 RepID=A0A6V7PRL0_ANACO|nr:unnamed protein product [Ananas comosus var. bracteatus]
MGSGGGGDAYRIPPTGGRTPNDDGGGSGVLRGAGTHFGLGGGGNGGGETNARTSSDDGGGSGTLRGSPPHTLNPLSTGAAHSAASFCPITPDKQLFTSSNTTSPTSPCNSKRLS